jgi:hypothetical protein
MMTDSPILGRSGRRLASLKTAVRSGRSFPISVIPDAKIKSFASA